MIKKLLLTLVAGLLIAAPAYAASDRVETYDYNMPGSAEGPQVYGEFGAVNVKSKMGEKTIEATIEDTTGEPQAVVVFEATRKHHDFKEIGRFCGSTDAPIAIHGGRQLTFSFVSRVPNDCGATPVGQATVGTLTVTYQR